MNTGPPSIVCRIQPAVKLQSDIVPAFLDKLLGQGFCNGTQLCVDPLKGRSCNLLEEARSVDNEY